MKAFYLLDTCKDLNRAFTYLRRAIPSNFEPSKYPVKYNQKTTIQIAI